MEEEEKKRGKEIANREPRRVSTKKEEEEEKRRERDGEGVFSFLFGKMNFLTRVLFLSGESPFDWLSRLRHYSGLDLRFRAGAQQIHRYKSIPRARALARARPPSLRVTVAESYRLSLSSSTLSSTIVT